MFCGNCGNKINTDEKYCSNCGTEVSRQKDSYAKNIGNYFFAILTFIKKFTLKYKKQVVISTISCIILILGIITFNVFYDPSKIVWNEKNSANVEQILSTTLNYEVDKIIKKEGNNNITWKVSGGKIIVDSENDTKASWELPKESGKYTITAQFRGKKIKRSVTVLEKDIAGGISFEEIGPSGDEDSDGLTNEQEEKYKTDIYSIDSDKDGLSDNYEINTSKTDPLKYDSDEDNVSDGDEVALNLNPLNKYSQNDNISDDKRKLNYTVNNDKVTLNIEGTGNLATTTIDVLQNETIKNIDGILSELYIINSDGNLEKRQIEINYDDATLQEKGYNEDDLNIYNFDEINKKFYKIDTIIDKDNNLLNAELKDNGIYLIANSTILKDSIETEIYFLIDNSGSMYSKELDESFDENDPNFRRVDLSVNLINKLSGSYKFGAGKFTFSYSNLSSLTEDRNSVINSIKSIKTGKENFNGTYIGNALYNSTLKFNSVNDVNKYIILLTDGVDTEGFGYDSDKINDAIKEAKKKNIKVITIGLGNSVDTVFLSRIAAETGGIYYHASSDNILEQIYNQIAQDINYNLIDTDEDDTVDSFVIADSKFRPNINGFSFENFVSNVSGGFCAGFAAFSELYYTNNLSYSGNSFTIKNGEEVKQINSYNLSNIEDITSHKNLYDIKFNDLKLLTSEQATYAQKIEKNGISYYLDSNKEYLKNLGYDFYVSNNIERPKLNLYSDNFNKNVPEKEREIINALAWHWANQSNYEKIAVIHHDDSMDTLVQKVSNGIPIYTAFKVDKILGSIGLGGGHAVNIYKISQSIENPNELKFYVYDNNYPGEERYMTVERTKLKILDPIISGSEYSYDVKYEWSNNSYNTSNIMIYDLH